jgi:hypothetical protein
LLGIVVTTDDTQIHATNDAIRLKRPLARIAPENIPESVTNQTTVSDLSESTVKIVGTGDGCWGKGSPSATKPLVPKSISITGCKFQK